MFWRLFLGVLWACSVSAIELLPHQREPINYLISHAEVKGLLINHYMGTGKTFLAIGLAEKYPDAHVVVMAPRFIEGHWLSQMRQFGVKNTDRYEFVSYQEAPEKLLKRDMRKTVLILDEVHNIVRYLKSSNPEKNKQYVDLYSNLQKSKRILGLTGTPIYNSEYDLSILLNLVSGQELLPYNEEEFRLQYTQVVPWRSFWRGYYTESMIIRNMTPSVYGAFFGSIFLSPFVGLGVFTAGMIAYPVINALVPLEKFHMRKLDAERLRLITSQYVSFYEIEEAHKDEFPAQERHVEEIDYEPWQFELFLRFAEMNLPEDELAWMMREEDVNPDPEYIRVNSTLLQKQLRSVPGAGRDIGNFGAEPPKFKRVLEKMQPGQKTVIYSNYYENGLKLFAKYLDTHGYAGKYAVLLPDMEPEQFSGVVADYNAGKKTVLLLHPEIKEGVSLNGTRLFHILERVLNSTTQEQIIARAVRYQSHIELPKADRRVDVYLWKAVLGGFNLKNFELRKDNWLKRYRELSDWADFGRGITQIDKNYDFKMYSPDEYSAIRVNDLKENITVLKEVLSKNSIEAAGGVKKEPPAQNLELPYPTTVFSAAYYFKPELDWLGSKSFKKIPEIDSGLAYQVAIDVPMYENLNAGGYIGFAGYQISGSQDRFYILGTGLSLKVPYRFRFAGQVLSPYVTVSAGIVSVLDIQGQIASYTRMNNEVSANVGFGLSGYGAAGLEYHPWSLVGLYIEGGWQAMLVGHRVIEAPNNDTWRLNAYWMRNWQLGFGLRLGF